MKQLLLMAAMLLGMQPLCAQSKQGPLRTERIPIYKGDTLIRHHFAAFGELPGRRVDVWLPKMGGRATVLGPGVGARRTKYF